MPIDISTSWNCTICGLCSGWSEKQGDKLDDRSTLVQRLALVNIDVTGISDNVTWYDKSLVAPIKQFQKMHGLKSDGIIGPNTLKWLNMKVPDRLALLALNAERMRLWSTNDDTVIVVNVPGLTSNIGIPVNLFFSPRSWWAGYRARRPL